MSRGRKWSDEEFNTSMSLPAISRFLSLMKSIRACPESLNQSSYDAPDLSFVVTEQLSILASTRSRQQDSYEVGKKTRFLARARLSTNVLKSDGGIALNFSSFCTQNDRAIVVPLIGFMLSMIAFSRSFSMCSAPSRMFNSASDQMLDVKFTTLSSKIFFLSKSECSPVWQNTALAFL